MGVIDASCSMVPDLTIVGILLSACTPTAVNVMQLSLINTTVICLHPAPLLHAIAFREFQPPLGVLIAICVLSPVITLAVTLWVRPTSCSLASQVL